MLPIFTPLAFRTGSRTITVAGPIADDKFDLWSGLPFTNLAPNKFFDMPWKSVIFYPNNDQVYIKYSKMGRV